MNDYIDDGSAPDWVGAYATTVLEDVADAWDLPYEEQLDEPLVLQPVPEEDRGRADLEGGVLYLPDPDVVTEDGMKRNIRGEISHALSALPVTERPHTSYRGRVMGELFEGLTEMRYEPDQVDRYLDGLGTIVRRASGIPLADEDSDRSPAERRIDRVKCIPGIESGHLAGYALARELHEAADLAELVRQESDALWTDEGLRDRVSAYHDEYGLGGLPHYTEAGI